MFYLTSQYLHSHSLSLSHTHTYRKKKSTLKDEFRKPIWVEEDDSDDELFDNRKIYGVQIFTNPIEMQKYFEQQMQEMWKSLDEYDGKR